MTLHLTGRKYLRAAEARLAAVKLLQENGFNFEAVYLAGYVVECSLKALLLARTPLLKQADLMKRSFIGRRGHNFDSLRSELLVASVPIPTSIVAHLLTVKQWSTDMRYEIGALSSAHARGFVDSAVAVLEWATRSF